MTRKSYFLFFSYSLPATSSTHKLRKRISSFFSFFFLVWGKFISRISLTSSTCSQLPETDEKTHSKTPILCCYVTCLPVCVSRNYFPPNFFLTFTIKKKNHKFMMEYLEISKQERKKLLLNQKLEITNISISAYFSTVLHSEAIVFTNCFRFL